MKRYTRLFEATLEKDFEKYFLNKDEFGTRMVNDVKIMKSKGEFIKDSDVKKDLVGKRSDCETNSYRYAKNNNMQVVQGYAHDSDDEDSWWFGHSWVYDPATNTHIEVTPGVDGSKGRVGRIVKPELLKKSLGKWGELKQGDYE